MRKERLVWTWPGGSTYSLVMPFGMSGPPPLHIESEEGRICSGRSVGRAFRPATGQQSSRPIIEWEFNDGMVVLCEGRNLCAGRIPRTWALHQVGGRRLAFWTVRRGGYGGVWRESLGERDLPVIAGMVIAQFYDL